MQEGDHIPTEVLRAAYNVSISPGTCLDCLLALQQIKSKVTERYKNAIIGDPGQGIVLYLSAASHLLKIWPA